MTDRNITPNYTLAQLVQSTDLIRQAGTVDFSASYTDIAIISGCLIRAAAHDQQLSRAMDRLAKLILAEEDRHYTEMAAEYGDNEAIRHKQAA